MAYKHLPSELVDQILLFSPVKSLARFKCVSQSWNSHISSPEFIESYGKTRRRAYPIFQTYRSARRKSIYFAWRGRDRIVKLKPPPVGKYNYIMRLVGSSDGIVCYVKDSPSNNYLKLWGPSLEESLNVDAPSVEDKALLSYAVGHHPDTSDLNLVQLSSNRGHDLVCKLYSHQARKWRPVGARLHLGVRRAVEIGWQSQRHSGRFHWLVLGEEFRAVVWYDPRSDALGLMDLPESLGVVVRGGREDRRIKLPKLGNYDGKLTVLAYGERPPTQGSRHSCAVWVLEEYGSPSSWRELGLEIEFEEEFRMWGFFDTFAVLYFIQGGRKVLYDVGTKRPMHILDAGCFAGIYEETFFHLTDPQNKSASKRRREWD